MNMLIKTSVFILNFMWESSFFMCISKLKVNQFFIPIIGFSFHLKVSFQKESKFLPSQKSNYFFISYRE